MNFYQGTPKPQLTLRLRFIESMGDKTLAQLKNAPENQQNANFRTILQTTKNVCALVKVTSNHC